MDSVQHAFWKEAGGWEELGGKGDVADREQSEMADIASGVASAIESYTSSTLTRLHRRVRKLMAAAFEDFFGESVCLTEAWKDLEKGQRRDIVEWCFIHGTYRLPHSESFSAMRWASRVLVCCLRKEDPHDGPGDRRKG